MKFFVFFAMCGLVVVHSRRYPYEDTDSSGARRVRPHRKIEQPRISVKLAKAISGATTIEEFLDLVTDTRKRSKVSGTSDSFDGLERSRGNLAVPAGCMPELQTVRVEDEVEYDSGKFYFPPCIRLNRCGGCCGSMLSCQPTKVNIKNFEFVVSTISTAGEVIPNERKIIPLEEHVECECECTMKPKDCPAKAIYEEDHCECICQNFDEHDKCDDDYEFKEWDESTCSCHCREEQACNPGLSFNLETCRCERDSNPRKMLQTWGDFHSLNLPATTTAVRRRGNKDDPQY